MNARKNTVKQLDEVNFIRPIAIILLVFIHALAPYTGAWSPTEGFEHVEVYKWTGLFISGCRIEALTFISGYLFAYIVKIKGRHYTLASLVKQKFKRLIIPSIIFSLIYSFIFNDVDYLSFGFLYELLNGVGHMWYLPMLFWCIIATYYLFRINIKESHKIIFLFVFALFDFLPLPLRMGNTIHFLFFFYLGSWCLQNKQYILKYATLRNIFVCLGTYILVFIICITPREILQTYWKESSLLPVKAFYLSIYNLCKLIYASIGLSTLYIAALYVTSRKDLPQGIKDFNHICYGIYIFQQFILIYIYYHTPLPSIIGIYGLPWVGFLIALSLSMLLSTLFVKTKIGRFLVG